MTWTTCVLRHRGNPRRATAGLLCNAHAASQQVTAAVIPEHVADRIEDAALVTCWGRGVVPRHGYGRREIDGAPVIEEPPRLVQQLHAIAAGLYSLGLDDHDVEHLTRRVALDSMPASRLAVLDVLSHGEADMPTAAVARAAGLHRHVTRHQLEELEAIGVVEGRRIGDDDQDADGDRLPRLWTLNGEEGDIIADAFAAHRASSGRWHEVWELPTPPPLKIKEETPGTRGDDRATPHFVPPPGARQAAP